MLWVILLAGGSGSRLAHESVRRFGYAKPKQFWSFGHSTLLELTLGRARLFAPDARIVVITTASHRDDALAVMRRHPHVIHLEQPRNRDTTSGLLWPLLHIMAHDAAATVIVMPTDHVVTQADVFRGAVTDALALIRANPEQIAILGAEPTGQDEDYGWLLPAAPTPNGPPTQNGGRFPSVARFREKPIGDELGQLRKAGALINTFVLIARADTLERAFAQWAPACLAILTRARGEPARIAAAFEHLPTSSFSRDVLEHVPSHLRIVPLPKSAGWTDIGTPERLAQAGVPGVDAPRAAPASDSLASASQPGARH